MSSSSSSSPSVSERELEVASILQELPALVPLHYRVLLRWAQKRPRSRLKPHDDHQPCKDDEDHTPSSSPISPLCFSFDPPPQPQHQHQHQHPHPPSLLVRDVLRVKQQARAIARLREANRSLQREAERERTRYEALLGENSRLKRLSSRSRSRSSRADDQLVVPPRLWMPGGIYPCNAFGLPEGFTSCHVAAPEERKAATAEARRRRIEIKRRRKAERAAPL